MRLLVSPPWLQVFAKKLMQDQVEKQQAAEAKKAS